MGRDGRRGEERRVTAELCPGIIFPSPYPQGYGGTPLLPRAHGRGPGGHTARARRSREHARAVRDLAMPVVSYMRPSRGRAGRVRGTGRRGSTGPGGGEPGRRAGRAHGAERTPPRVTGAFRSSLPQVRPHRPAVAGRAPVPVPPTADRRSPSSPPRRSPRPAPTTARTPSRRRGSGKGERTVPDAGAGGRSKPPVTSSAGRSSAAPWSRWSSSSTAPRSPARRAPPWASSR